MPAALLGVVGCLLIALADYDALATTLAVGSGSRPLTARVATGLRRVVRRFPVLMPAGGPIVVLSTVAVWISLLWVGASLLFLADGDAIVSATTGDPASTVSRIYYAGYTLFTLGNGGYAPAVGGWEVVTVLVTLNGLFVVTLAITYMVPVVSAVVQRRELAAVINALGPTAEDVLIAAWDGHGFSYLDQQLPTLSQQIILTAQRHLAYPVLHDFRSSNPQTASERTLAMLDDVLTVLQHGVAPEVRISAPVMRTAQFAVDEARRLMPLDGTADATPPLPDLAVLAAHGVPVRSPAQFAADAEALAERRRHLSALVQAARWRWPNRAGDPDRAGG